MTTGVCRSAACANAHAALTPVELYPGPGRYCPQCGDALEPLASAPAPAAPFGGLTALEALAQFDAGDALPAEPARRSHAPKRSALVAASAGLAVVAAVAFLRPGPVQHPAVAAASNAVRVCRSGMAERFAADVVRAYAGKPGAPPSAFVLTRSGRCDVRVTVIRRTGRPAVALTVESRSRAAGVTGLAAFARSARAHAIAARDGFVAGDGIR